MTTAANVAVIGETVRKNLFGATDPVGQTIRINNLPFKVVGLLEAEGHIGAMGKDQDDVVVVPITTLQKKMTGTGLAALDHGVGGLERSELHRAAADHVPYCATATAFAPDRTTTSSCATWLTWPTWPTRRRACSPYCWPRSPAFR